MIALLLSMIFYLVYFNPVYQNLSIAKKLRVIIDYKGRSKKDKVENIVHIVE